MLHIIMIVVTKYTHTHAHNTGGPQKQGTQTAGPPGEREGAQGSTATAKAKATPHDLSLTSEGGRRGGGVVQRCSTSFLFRQVWEGILRVFQ